MLCRVRLLLAISVGLLMACFVRAESSTPAALDHFEKKVRPLLAARCYKCHAGVNSKGGLRLDSADALAAGGDSGPVVVPGKPDDSRLIHAVRHQGELKMPPKERLPTADVDVLVAWVRSGAAWPKSDKSLRTIPKDRAFSESEKTFWAFQKPKEHKPPVKHADRFKAPIDRFLLARLEERGLSFAPPADKRTLLRRVTFDLTGLPPTPAEIDGFLADQSAEAFAKVVDRLLTSPHYGERWGRHWLDVVRYADTTANDANAVMPYACRYRDYVVDAFNRDLPYDQFLIEQLAGDLLPPTADLSQSVRRVIATGFLMVGPKALAETDKEQSRIDVVDDQIDVLGRAVLGLTLACARCHDHKFDPILTSDYYALAGIFRSTEVFQDEARNATMWQQWPLLQIPGEKPLMVMAPKEAKTVNLRIHIRGNRFKLGEEVPRRFPLILAGEKQPALSAAQSGRLELAQWIANKDNPLTARVMVNRVWQLHFGIGLVATSDNFGVRGELPSHPQLLDWLAVKFMEHGWSVKSLHKLMLLTHAYQMESRPNPQAMQVDPNNRLLWRMPRQRLDSEALRDSLLAISGQLDRAIGDSTACELLYNESEQIDAKRGFGVNRWQSNHPFYVQCRRRSIYLPVVRNVLPDAMALFDAADPNGVTAVRNDTTVASQSLYLLNSPIVRDQALHFARSLLSGVKGNDHDRLRQAYLRALGRPPTADELAEAAGYLNQYAGEARKKPLPETEATLLAWQSYCQLLFCLNEFLYVD